MTHDPRVPSEASISDLRAGLATGAFTGAALVAHFLERIARLDDGKLNSVRQTNPDALEIARGLDRERAGGRLGPLHGIPVLLKDNINTADGLQTTAGSRTLEGHIAATDAHLVTRLRAAGAIILGKVNMTEWANFITTNMPNGYSALGGQVNNPYGAFDVGGSSSGSGASIAAYLAAVAVGTETSGSILSPSVNNSLVGIKPTVGLVSRTGIIPIASSQDTAGPMARTVADAAALLEVIAGVDPNDPATARQPSAMQSNAVRYTDFLDTDGLRGARLGVPRAYYWKFVTPEQRPTLEAAITALKDGGATVVEDADIESAQAVADLGYTVLLHEFKRDLDAYLRELERPFPRSLLEVIRLNEAHFKTHLKYGQTLMLAAHTAAGADSAYYRETRADDLRLSTTDGGIDATLERHGLDALVMPMYWGAQIGAKAGYPTVTVPCGYTPEGQPVGISFMGRAWDEAKLIRIAHAFEQLTRARRAPSLETA